MLSIFILTELYKLQLVATQAQAGGIFCALPLVLPTLQADGEGGGFSKACEAGLNVLLMDSDRTASLWF